MELPDEVKQAAVDLGKRLGAAAGVQEYVVLNEKIQTDPEIGRLESKVARMYQDLVERQENGEDLQQAEVDAYYALKQQLEGHPWTTARDARLVGVKAMLAETAQRMTPLLGLDYTTLAK
ncbi:MAG TPA: YlbF family regulator [Anaerolineales bacterium]|jgi:cell fate (sporulation/competence/biofilm development) regulator YlbF (YheA/YmcA/DUF963 family)